ncbi:MAG: glycerol-3-phosphate dehydrogenase/oxidase [Halioglobus sp.]
MNSKQTLFTDREQLLADIRRGDNCDWDIIIVGGGITGAGVLREAVRRGYKALLLEQKDFAWGTSSRSSKMVHGGLRYLGMGDIKLTRHSLTERELLLREAPGLVDRMGYYFTLRKGVFPGRWVFSIMLWLYDRIAGIRDNRYYSTAQLLEKFPGLEEAGLKGACYYTDAVTDDARLVLRVLQESIASGGSALNYTAVKELIIEQDEVQGVLLTDPDSGEALCLRAPVVINATGAWADRLRGQVNKEKRVRPLRGSHLVLPGHKLPAAAALALMHPGDKRSVFIFPWEGTTVVGTTDLDHNDDLDTEASITAQEVDYLLEAANSQFPKCKLSAADVISTWAGVRPVIGSEQSKDPSKERRDHAVWSDHGLITVSGGKLTTFRLIALDALAAAEARLPKAQPWDCDRIFSANSTSPESLVPDDKHWGARLLGRYGSAAASLLSASSSSEHKRIDGTEFSLAECRWAARHETVVHLDDLLLRRTRLGLLLAGGGESLFEELQAICTEELGWNETRWQAELSRYRQIWLRYYNLPRPEPAVTGETDAA